MPWISRERVALHHNGERATDIINTVLNDVKCSKASNNLCIIHDPCVTILLLFQGTFPPVFFFFFVFFLCRESCCCRRDEAEKHLSLEAAEKQMNVKDRSPEPVVFSCLRLFIFFVIPHIFFKFFFFFTENCSSGRIINMFLEFYLFSTLSSRYKRQHVLRGINTQTDVELVKILSKWPANSQTYKTTVIIT